MGNRVDFILFSEIIYKRYLVLLGVNGLEGSAFYIDNIIIDDFYRALFFV